LISVDELSDVSKRSHAEWRNEAEALIRGGSSSSGPKKAS
jgi:hypothetical protein